MNTTMGYFCLCGLFWAVWVTFGYWVNCTYAWYCGRYMAYFCGICTIRVIRGVHLLPVHVKSSPSISTFRQRLKHFCFILVISRHHCSTLPYPTTLTETPKWLLLFRPHKTLTLTLTLGYFGLFYVLWSLPGLLISVWHTGWLAHERQFFWCFLIGLGILNTLISLQTVLSFTCKFCERDFSVF